MDFNAVHHDFDVVGLVAVHHHAELQLAHFAVDAHTGEARLTDVFEQFAVVTFSGSDRRCQNIDASTVKFLENQVGDLFLGVTHHRLAGVIGVGCGDAGVEQAKEVVNLGDGAYRGARVFVHALLLDADNGAETSDLVHIGAFHVADELSRVCREALHVTALSLGVDSVKSQRRLAAPADAGDDHQGIAWNRKVDVLQVVLASTVNL